MRNKKAGFPADELFGTTRWLFVLVVALLFFYGCSVFDLKKTSNQITDSENDLDAAKSLNYFLGFPVNDQNSILDLIGESYKSGNYGEFNKMQREYFSGKYVYWKLIISDKNDNVLYESNEFKSSMSLSGQVSKFSESEVNAFVIDKEGKLETVTILLQTFNSK